MQSIEVSSLVAGRHGIIAVENGNVQTTDDGDLVVVDTENPNELFYCKTTSESLNFFHLFTESVPSVSSDISSITSASATKTAAETSVDEDLSDGFRWELEAVLLLLSEYQNEEDSLNSGKISAKKFWMLIANRLKTKGHNITDGQCKSKFSGLKKLYKKIKDHNGKSGNDRRTWRYFEVMDKMFSSKPWVQPALVLESSEASPSTSRPRSPPPDRSEQPSKRQRRSDSESKLVQEIAASREERRKMHDDYMKAQDRLISVLEKLADKAAH